MRKIGKNLIVFGILSALAACGNDAATAVASADEAAPGQELMQEPPPPEAVDSPDKTPRGRAGALEKDKSGSRSAARPKKAAGGRRGPPAQDPAAHSGILALRGEDGDGVAAVFNTASAKRERTPAPGVTGGTFQSAGVNPVVKTADDRLSTFAIDVDTGSYHYSKSILERGQLPSPAAVRVEEWVNAFHYSYADDDRAPFTVHTAAAPSPLDGKKHLFRVGVQGRRLDRDERKAVHLTFLVDVSGSMSDANKLPLAKRAMKELVKNLRDDDRIAIVTYAGATGEVLPSTSAADKRTIFAAIDNMKSSGGTNMDSGMTLAFRNAGKHLSDKVHSRVVVLSDGDANIGRTSHQQILEAVKGYVSEGVTLSTVGFGHGNYNDHLMEQLADAGNGNYSYIDSESTARRVFGTDLVQNLEVIAQDVKIQVDFDPAVVADYRLIGYENRDLADADFRNDKKDAGEIGAGHTVTALYEMTLKPGASADATVATVRVRHKKPRGQRATEREHPFVRGDVKARFADLDEDTRFAGAVALAAEYLRGSPYTPAGALRRAADLAQAATGTRFAAERKEFVAVVQKAQHNERLAQRR